MNHERLLKPSDEATATEKILDSIQGKGAPMEQTHAEAPTFLVFASFPLVVIAGIVLVIVAYWLTRS